MAGGEQCLEGADRVAKAAERFVGSGEAVQRFVLFGEVRIP